MKNYLFPLFFFLLGVISIIGQGVILREITTLFYGNEIYYGIGLGMWMLFTGTGSLIILRIKLSKISSFAFWIILAVLYILLPLVIVMTRYLVAKSVPAGQLPGLFTGFISPLVILSAFCFPLGALFPLYISGTKNENRVNHAYLWETIGFALGGIFFSFLLAGTAFPLPEKINALTLSWRYPNLQTAVNSKYNQIIITEKDGQKNFFLNGQLTVTSQEKLETKQFLSLVIPYVKKAENILILGNPNLAKEIKEIFPRSKLDYLEADEELLNLEKDLLPRGINPIFYDARNYLGRSDSQWDLIIFTPGNPQTLLTNRYYTKEVFRIAHDRLNRNGIFTLSFYIPTDYQSQETVLFGSSVYQTYKNIFPYTQLLSPEDQIILMGSKEEMKFDETKINPKMKDYVLYQMENRKKEEIAGKFSSEGAKINSDFEPAAFFYQQLFWQTIFNFHLPKVTSTIAYIIPFILIFAFWIISKNSGKEMNYGLIVAVSGFILMGIETLIIFLFQSKIGYLYSEICLIFAAVLLGLAAGVALSVRMKNRLFILKTGNAFYLLLLIIFSISLYLSISEWLPFWFILAFATGVIGGLIFALTNSQFLSGKNDPGFIYAFDLFGSSLGAILTAGLLLPIYGVKGVVFFFTLLIFINFRFIARLRE